MPFYFVVTKRRLEEAPIKGPLTTNFNFFSRHSTITKNYLYITVAIRLELKFSSWKTTKIACDIFSLDAWENPS